MKLIVTPIYGYIIKRKLSLSFQNPQTSSDENFLPSFSFFFFFNSKFQIFFFQNTIYMNLFYRDFWH